MTGFGGFLLCVALGVVLGGCVAVYLWRRAIGDLSRTFFEYRILAPLVAFCVPPSFGLAVVLSNLDGPIDPDRLGTLGEWVGGVGAFAAVAVALAVVKFDVSARRSDEEFAEAVKVFCYASRIGGSIPIGSGRWIREPRETPQGPELIDRCLLDGTYESDASWFHVLVKNSSSTPAYDVEVHYRERGSNVEWAKAESIRYDLGSDCIIPGDTAYPPHRDDPNRPRYVRVTTTDRAIDLRLTYRSSTGRYWQIESGGDVQFKDPGKDWQDAPQRKR